MFSAISDFVWGEEKGVDEKPIPEIKDSIGSDDDWVMVEGTRPAPGNLAVAFNIHIEESASLAEVAEDELVGDLEEFNDTATDDVKQTRSLDSFIFQSNIVDGRGQYFGKSLTRKALERSNKCMAVSGNKKKVDRNNFQMKIPQSKRNYRK